uniref:methyltransferase domain-containing protein n=1 Tax=Acetatifactor sp. TaxID=1872090 RepID=UPI004057A159
MIQCWCGNENLNEYSKDYFCCKKCHTLISKTAFLDTVYDVEDEDNDLYGKNYWEVSMTRAAGKNTLSEVVDMYLTERVIYWLKHVLKYVKLGADIAEVGCGLGQLQYVLNRLNYNQLAFELSADICDYMEQKLGVNAHCGAFTEKKAGYDAILAFDLFEHLIEPLEFMQQCFNSLKENGVLCFQTPCYDSELSYDEMSKSKGKFEEQLKAEQHIFLYSRESITDILKKHGFEYIIFEPAFFGDDYDMFLFASKEPIQTNTEQEIDDYLNSAPNGRLVKAMIKLFDERKELECRYQDADRDRGIRLEQNQQLEQLLKESETDRAARQEQISELTKALKESETDRAARQEQIDELTRMLQESQANRTVEQEQLNELARMLQESEADRAARLEQINELTRLLQESEADRAARLEQINELTRIINESKVSRK